MGVAQLVGNYSCYLPTHGSIPGCLYSNICGLLPTCVGSSSHMCGLHCLPTTFAKTRKKEKDKHKKKVPFGLFQRTDTTENVQVNIWSLITKGGFSRYTCDRMEKKKKNPYFSLGVLSHL